MIHPPLVANDKKCDSPDVRHTRMLMVTVLDVLTVRIHKRVIKLTMEVHIELKLDLVAIWGSLALPGRVPWWLKCFPSSHGASDHRPRSSAALPWYRKCFQGWPCHGQFSGQAPVWGRNHRQPSGPSGHHEAPGAQTARKDIDLRNIELYIASMVRLFWDVSGQKLYWTLLHWPAPHVVLEIEASLLGKGIPRDMTALLTEGIVRALSGNVFEVDIDPDAVDDHPWIEHCTCGGPFQPHPISPESRPATPSRANVVNAR